MWFWRKIISLFRKWQTMADEAIETTQSTSPTAQQSTGPVFPVDPDLRPIGACYPDGLEVQRLIAELKRVQHALKTAVTAWGDCRAAAAANVSKRAMAAQGLGDFTTDLQDLEHLIDSFEDSAQIWIDSSVCDLPPEQSNTPEETLAP